MINFKITTHNLNLYYGKFQALVDINLEIYKNKITALIGPSGCGKSSLLRCLNRMNDLIDGVKIEGEVKLHGLTPMASSHASEGANPFRSVPLFAPDGASKGYPPIHPRVNTRGFPRRRVKFNGKGIYNDSIDVTELRRRVGMVYQRPNPFPLSVFANCVYGARVHGIHNRQKLTEIAYQSLTLVLLWDELKDRLEEPALSLSDEQKQRLCIARLLAVNSEVLLLDEPCSQLDPVATQKIEELLVRLKKTYTIVIVTHNMQQAARISDFTGFFHLGEMLEYGRTEKIFTAPDVKKTEEYIQGRFG